MINGSSAIDVLVSVFLIRRKYAGYDLYSPHYCTLYPMMKNPSQSPAPPGGFRVLMPFCFLSGLNGVFNLCVFVQFPILVPYTILTTSLGILEVACAVLGYKIYKIVSNTQLGGGGSWGAGGGGAAGGGVGGGGLFDGGGGPRGQDGPPGGSSAAPRPYITSGLSGRSNEPFQVFQGQGRRLGDSS